MLFATNGLLPFVWLWAGRGSCTETMEEVVRGSDLVENYNNMWVRISLVNVNNQI